MKKESLFILPFDHRGSFLKNLFNLEDRKPSQKEIDEVKELKWLIYSGFKYAINQKLIPQSSTAILIDDEFGEKIIEDAKSSGYKVSISTEISGQDEFQFEHGEDFGAYLKKYSPDSAKALIRYNPEEDEDLNKRQLTRLKKLNDYCKKEGIGFLLEPLVIATQKQMEEVDQSKERYDREMRPKLMVDMIREIREFGIEPDIWKLEGLDKEEDYENLAKEIHPDSRIIILGRGADTSQVERWIAVGAGVEKVIGFAIGRTVFWQPLLDYKNERIDKGVAIERIANNFSRFYRIFIESKESI
ncbi:MAG: DUF2090 domain-containing protein [Minisyncoccales bacterium]|jgi:myo-inositol catabolism protein IolC